MKLKHLALALLTAAATIFPATASAQTIMPKVTDSTAITAPPSIPRISDYIKLASPGDVFEIGTSETDVTDDIVVKHEAHQYDTEWRFFALSDPADAARDYQQDRTDPLPNRIKLPVTGSWSIYPMGLTLINGVLSSTKPLQFQFSPETGKSLAGTNLAQTTVEPNMFTTRDWIETPQKVFEKAQLTSYWDEGRKISLVWLFVPQRNGNYIVIDVKWVKATQLVENDRTLPAYSYGLVGRNPATVKWSDGEKLELIDTSYVYSQYFAKGGSTDWQLFMASWAGTVLKRLSTNEIILSTNPYDFMFDWKCETSQCATYSTSAPRTKDPSGLLFVAKPYGGFVSLSQLMPKTGSGI